MSVTNEEILTAEEAEIIEAKKVEANKAKPQLCEYFGAVINRNELEKMRFALIQALPKERKQVMDAYIDRLAVVSRFESFLTKAINTPPHQESFGKHFQGFEFLNIGYIRALLSTYFTSWRFEPASVAIGSHYSEKFDKKTKEHKTVPEAIGFIAGTLIVEHPTKGELRFAGAASDATSGNQPTAFLGGKVLSIAEKNAAARIGAAFGSLCRKKQQDINYLHHAHRDGKVVGGASSKMIKMLNEVSDS
jgi:hypothetical protein